MTLGSSTLGFILLMRLSGLPVEFEIVAQQDAVLIRMFTIHNRDGRS